MNRALVTGDYIRRLFDELFPFRRIRSIEGIFLEVVFIDLFCSVQRLTTKHGCVAVVTVSHILLVLFELHKGPERIGGSILSKRMCREPSVIILGCPLRRPGRLSQERTICFRPTRP